MNWRRAAAVCAVVGAVTCAGCAREAPVPGSAAPKPAPACVNPLTGTVRSQGVMTSRQGLVVAALAADPTAREVAAVVSGGGYTGVVAISPPRACWSPRPT